jgi:hypothetical protein
MNEFHPSHSLSSKRRRLCVGPEMDGGGCSVRGAGIPCGGIGGLGCAGPPHWPQPDLPPLLDACPRASLQAGEREREKAERRAAAGRSGREGGKKNTRNLFPWKGKKLLLGPPPMILATLIHPIHPSHPIPSNPFTPSALRTFIQILFHHPCNGMWKSA